MDDILFKDYQKEILYLANTEAGRFLLGIKDNREIFKVTPNSIHLVNDIRKNKIFIYSKNWTFNKVSKLFLPFIEYEKILNQEYGEYLSRHLGINEKYKRFLAYEGLEGHLQLEIPQIYNTNYDIGSYDGVCNSDGSPISQSTWDTIHDASTTTDGGADHAGDSFCVDVGNIAGSYIRITRAFAPADTSLIGGGATLISASFNGKIKSKADNHPSYKYFSLVQTSQSPTDLVNDDFDLCGDAINNPTIGATNVNYADITVGNWKEIPLNSTGLGWVNKTGWTKIGFRSGHDCSDIYDGSYRSYAYIYSSRSSGNEPYLSVIYSLGAALIFGANF